MLEVSQQNKLVVCQLIDRLNYYAIIVIRTYVCPSARYFTQKAASEINKKKKKEKKEREEEGGIDIDRFSSGSQSDSDMDFAGYGRGYGYRCGFGDGYVY